MYASSADKRQQTADLNICNYNQRKNPRARKLEIQRHADFRRVNRRHLCVTSPIFRKRTENLAEGSSSFFRLQNGNI